MRLIHRVQLSSIAIVVIIFLVMLALFSCQAGAEELINNKTEQAGDMELDGALILAILALVVSGPLGWIISNVVADLKKITEKLTSLEIHIAENYVEKDDLHRELGDIKKMVQRIFDKLDAMALNKK